MGNPHFRFVQANICNSELVELLLREEGIDTLVHFAAESHRITSYNVCYTKLLRE